MKYGNSRICLGGEDLDWCQGCTLQLPINLKTITEFSLTNNSLDTLIVSSKIKDKNYTLRVSSSDIKNWVYNGNFWDYTIAGINSFKYFTGIFPCGTLNIISDIPEKSGLCSSAAFFISLLKELNNKLQLHLASKDIIEIAFYAEKNIIGAKVGRMDYYASLTQNIFLYNSKEKLVTDINYSRLHEIKFYVVYSGESSSSKIVNQEKFKRFLTKEKNFMEYIYQANYLVNSFSSDLKNNCSPEIFGQYLNHFQILMKEKLRVSTNKIDKLIHILNNIGSIGSKITGCGLGGYIACAVLNQNNIYFESKLKKMKVRYIKCSNL